MARAVSARREKVVTRPERESTSAGVEAPWARARAAASVGRRGRGGRGRGRGSADDENENDVPFSFQGTCRLAAAAAHAESSLVLDGIIYSVPGIAREREFSARRWIEFSMLQKGFFD